MASVAVEEQVGASLKGRASSSTWIHIWALLFLARIESLKPLIPMMGILRSVSEGTILSNSSVCPLYEIPITISPSDTTPKSPWYISKGLT